MLWRVDLMDLEIIPVPLAGLLTLAFAGYLVHYILRMVSLEDNEWRGTHAE